MTTFRRAAKKMAMFLSSDDMKTREDNGANVGAIPLLVEVNSLGLITIDSQMGDHEKTAKSDYFERAYLDGFMTKARAKEFLLRINMVTDKIAMAAVVGPNEPLRSVTVTKTLWPNGRWEHHTRWCPVYPRSNFLQQMDKAGLSRKLVDKVVLVTLLDAQWGRATTAKDGLLRQTRDVLKSCIKQQR